MKETLEKNAVYCKKDNLTYAGSHLVIEVWDAKNINNDRKIEELLREAAKACGATILYVHTHLFTPNDGVSGIAVLQESHIAIHTWPELGYAAVDIFVCGSVNPYDALPVFKSTFETEKVQVVEFKRGIFDEKQLAL